MLEIIANPGRLESDYDQEATLAETPHRLQLKFHLAMIASNEGYPFEGCLGYRP